MRVCEYLKKHCHHLISHLLMIDFFRVVPQFEHLSSNFFLTCLFTCSHHMFLKFSATLISLYSTIAIFPWLDNALPESINLILLKNNAQLACDQIFFFIYSLNSTRLCQTCKILLQHPL